MSMQDPIADMLTRIRNAQMVGGKQVRLSASKLKTAILNVMKEEGFISSFEVLQSGEKKDLLVTLAYYHGKPVIRQIRRISKVSMRVYSSAKTLPVISSGFGISIISTPLGVMTGKTAKKHNIGGEVLCTVE
jgi:small subunit ribosomal protein S8